MKKTIFFLAFSAIFATTAFGIKNPGADFGIKIPKPAPFVLFNYLQGSQNLVYGTITNCKFSDDSTTINAVLQVKRIVKGQFMATQPKTIAVTFPAFRRPHRRMPQTKKPTYRNGNAMVFNLYNSEGEGWHISGGLGTDNQKNMVVIEYKSFPMNDFAEGVQLFTKYHDTMAYSRNTDQPFIPKNLKKNATFEFLYAEMMGKPLPKPISKPKTQPKGNVKQNTKKTSKNIKNTKKRVVSKSKK